MRHAVFGKKLSRTKNERRRLLQGLVRELVTHGKIQTTLVKAKAVQPLVERLITKAKKGGNTAKMSLMKVLSHWPSTKILLAEGATRFAGRSSGFTRIIKLGQRGGDSAEMVLLQIVDERVEVSTIPSAVSAQAKPVSKRSPVKKQTPLTRKKK